MTDERQDGQQDQPDDHRSTPTSNEPERREEKRTPQNDFDPDQRIPLKRSPRLRKNQ